MLTHCSLTAFFYFSQLQVCCEWTWRIIVWPFRMLWRFFKWVFYPIKECCLDMCGACHECCYPSYVKL